MKRAPNNTLALGPWTALLTACALQLTATQARAQLDSQLDGQLNSQVDASAQLEALHQAGIDAYLTMDMAGALRELHAALSLAQAARLTGNQRARIELSIGVVHAAGLADPDTAYQHFIRAACADPAIQHDPLLASPELAALLQQAKVAAERTGCGFRPPPTAAAAATSAPLRSASARDPELPPVLQTARDESSELDAPAPAAALLVRAGAALGLPWLRAGMAADRNVSARGENLGPGCCLPLATQGFSPQLALRFEAGAFLGQRVTLSAIARLQPQGAGRGGPLAGVLLGGRIGYWLVGAAGATGATRVHSTTFSWSLFAGGSAGRIDVQPSGSNAYAISGLAGVHVGSAISLALTRDVALLLAPELDFQAPTFMFDIDVTSGLELRL